MMKSLILNISRLIASLFIASVALSSCNEVKNVAYSDFVAFGSEGWDPVCVLDFAPFPADSVTHPGEKFDLILTLRYSPRNLASEIPVEITEEDEEGVTGTKRVSIPLCDANGKPMGKRGIALYEISDTIRSNFALPEGYSLSIASLSPPSNTECLRNLGVTLVRSNKK